MTYPIDNDEVQIRIRFDADLWTSLNAADRAALVQNAIDRVSLADGVEHVDPVPHTNPQAGDDGNYLVTWSIDQEAASPELAAAAVWQEFFSSGLRQPAADDACVFTVESDATDPISIDLSDEVYTDLFDKE